MTRRPTLPAAVLLSLLFKLCLRLHFCVGVRVDEEHTSSLHVFSDVDDTLICSGGGVLGADDMCYEHELYPGAFQFELELSRGPEESFKPPRLIMISARPRELTTFGIMKIKPDHRAVVAAANVGKSNGFPKWGIDVKKAQYGMLVDQMLPKASSIGMGKTKYKSWAKFKTDRSTIFVGDNSEGDQVAAEMMAQASELTKPPNKLAAAFIHNVTFDSPPPTSDKIVVFDTYIDAAVKANALGLISSNAMLRVKETFRNSAIVQLCMHKRRFSAGSYPCTIGKGEILDSVTRMSVVGFTLRDDSTAILPECDSNPEKVEKLFKIDRNGRCGHLLDSLARLGS